MKKQNITFSPLSKFGIEDFTTHSIDTKYHGFFKLEQYHVSHKKFDDSISDIISREVFEREDAVVLLPYDPVKDRLVMIEQFRVGAIRSKNNPWLLEFIAGMFNANEQPVDVAIREAKEEANLDVDVDKVKKVMSYLSSPGGMSEAMHMYVAIVDSENAGGVHGLDEEHEDILVHVVDREKAMEMLTQGKITNAATIIGLQWLALNYQSL